MNGHVQKETARNLEIREGRRRRVAADEVKSPGAANLALFDCTSSSTIAGIEPAIEANLQFCSRADNCAQSEFDPRQSEIDWLLAKDVLSGLSCLLDDLGVRVGGRADHHGLDVRVVKQIAVCRDRARHAVFGSALASGVLDDVGYGQQPGARDLTRQVRGVKAPDAASADQSNVQHLSRSYVA
jgi:hypothetical protein